MSVSAIIVTENMLGGKEPTYPFEGSLVKQWYTCTIEKTIQLEASDNEETLDIWTCLQTGKLENKISYLDSIIIEKY